MYTYKYINIKYRLERVSQVGGAEAENPQTELSPHHLFLPSSSLQAFADPSVDHS